jgi:4-amino-4-deoxy-L-arabinose transferase-like glycosyltransferase
MPRGVSKSAIVLIALCLLFAAVTLVWLRLDRSAPHWDDSWYLANSLRLYDSLVEDGLAGFTKTFLKTFAFKAPLIAALPVPFYLALGRRWHAAYLVNVVSLFLLFGSVYRVGKAVSDARTGLLAVFIAGTMPLLYDLSR